MEEFHLVLIQCGLNSLSFTWTNGRVWQKLDRVLGNDSVQSLRKVSHCTVRAQCLKWSCYTREESAHFQFLPLQLRSDFFSKVSEAKVNKRLLLLPH